MFIEPNNAKQISEVSYIISSAWNTVKNLPVLPLNIHLLRPTADITDTKHALFKLQSLNIVFGIANLSSDTLYPTFRVYLTATQSSCSVDAKQIPNSLLYEVSPTFLRSGAVPPSIPPGPGLSNIYKVSLEAFPPNFIDKAVVRNKDFQISYSFVDHSVMGGSEYFLQPKDIIFSSINFTVEDFDVL